MAKTQMPARCSGMLWQLQAGIVIVQADFSW